MNDKEKFIEKLDKTKVKVTINCDDNKSVVINTTFCKVGASYSNDIELFNLDVSDFTISEINSLISTKGVMLENIYGNMRICVDKEKAKIVLYDNEELTRRNNLHNRNRNFE